MYCVLCKKEIKDNKDIVTTYDDFRTYHNEMHQLCWHRLKKWMQIHADKEWIMLNGHRAPGVKWAYMAPQGELWPDWLIRGDRRSRKTLYRTSYYSMLAFDEYPKNSRKVAL